MGVAYRFRKSGKQIFFVEIDPVALRNDNGIEIGMLRQKVQLVKKVLPFDKVLVPKPVLDLWMAGRSALAEDQF